MSGPKDDRVSIERRRQQELERQRRIEQERKIRVQNLQNNYANSVTNALSKIQKLDAQIVSFKEKIKEYEISSTSEMDSFEDLVKSLQSKLSSFPKHLTTEDENELNQKQNEINSFIASLNLSSDIKQVTESINNKYTNKLMSEISVLSKKIREDEFKRQNEEAKRQEELAQQKLLAEQKRQEELQKAKIEFEKTKNEIIAKIESTFSELDEFAYIPSDVSVELENIKNQFTKIKSSVNDGIDFLKNFYAITVTTSIKKYKSTIVEYQAFAESFNEKLSEYFVLCQELNEAPNNYPMTKDSLVFMQAEIDRLNKISEKANYERYIQQSINEVMAEMGYNVIGNLKEKSEGILESKLYQFDQHTAVSVTIDSYGDVCMELGGMDDTDRDPDMQEASALKADMEVFCTKHKEIKERLAKKGVILTKNHELPPDVEYAQIFNLNDFDVDVEQKDELLRNERNNTSSRANEAKHRTL